MVILYFETIGISSEREANVLSSSTGWDILSVLRHAGIDGHTAEELEGILDIPRSTVYNVLKELMAAGFVESRRYRKHIGRPSNNDEEELRTGKQKKIYIENINWGNFTFHHEFDRYLVESIDKIIDQSELSKYFLETIDKILEKMKKTTKGKQFLPSEGICPGCHYNHEAKEFLTALIMTIADRIRKDENFINKFQDKYGYEIGFLE